MGILIVVAVILFNLAVLGIVILIPVALVALVVIGARAIDGRLRQRAERRMQGSVVPS